MAGDNEFLTFDHDKIPVLEQCLLDYGATEVRVDTHAGNERLKVVRWYGIPKQRALAALNECYQRMKGSQVCAST